MENKQKTEYITKDTVVGDMNAKEIAAVVSAAIAAHEGDAKINFRIKSIKKL